MSANIPPPHTHTQLRRRHPLPNSTPVTLQRHHKSDRTSSESTASSRTKQNGCPPDYPDIKREEEAPKAAEERGREGETREDTVWSY